MSLFDQFLAWLVGKEITKIKKQKKINLLVEKHCVKEFQSQTFLGTMSTVLLCMPVSGEYNSFFCIHPFPNIFK